MPFNAYSSISQEDFSCKKRLEMTCLSSYDLTIDKIQQLPEHLVQEVSDFIDFLQMKHDSTLWQLWTHFTEVLEVVESDFSDYLSNLEDYEDRLARGEIRW